MAHAAQMRSSSTTTQRILDRMTPATLLPLPNDSSIKRTKEIFQDNVLNNSLNWQSWVTFRNDTPYIAQIGGSKVTPWRSAEVHVDSVNPEVKFLETQFLQGTVPLTEFHEVEHQETMEFRREPRRIFTLLIDFSKFTYASLQRNRKGELELKLRCEDQSGNELELQCEQQRGRGLRWERKKEFEFVNDFAGDDDIGDSVIHMTLKNGTEECSYRKIFSQDPRKIIKITTHVRDENEVKRIVLLAEGQ